jgi:hypothetical protein
MARRPIVDALQLCSRAACPPIGRICADRRPTTMEHGMDIDDGADLSNVSQVLTFCIGAAEIRIEILEVQEIMVDTGHAGAEHATARPLAL